MINISNKQGNCKWYFRVRVAQWVRSL